MGYVLTKTVYFVGFMGAGKTSVARRLARVCGACAVDADVYLGRRVGMGSSEMIEEFGVAAFREQETYALEELAAMPPAFIALGGGVVETPANRRILRDSGCVVFLDTTADQAANRISNLETRPLFGDIDNARELCERRRPQYLEIADVVLPTGSKPLSVLSKEVLEALVREGVLKHA